MYTLLSRENLWRHFNVFHSIYAYAFKLLWTRFHATRHSWTTASGLPCIAVQSAYCTKRCCISYHNCTFIISISQMMKASVVSCSSKIEDITYDNFLTDGLTTCKRGVLFKFTQWCCMGWHQLQKRLLLISDDSPLWIYHTSCNHVASHLFCL